MTAGRNGKPLLDARTGRDAGRAGDRAIANVRDPVWVRRMPVVPASTTVTIVYGSALVPDPVGPVWLTGVKPSRVTRRAWNQPEMNVPQEVPP